MINYRGLISFLFLRTSIMKIQTVGAVAVVGGIFHLAPR